MSGYKPVINKYALHPCAAALQENTFSVMKDRQICRKIPIRTDVETGRYPERNLQIRRLCKRAIPMEDTEAYTKACETVVERWAGRNHTTSGSVMKKQKIYLSVGTVSFSGGCCAVRIVPLLSVIGNSFISDGGSGFRWKTMKNFTNFYIRKQSSTALKYH